MCVCVFAAARGRKAMAPPPPAARGPPGRAHCSRLVSTGLARRPEPFRGSAPAPPSAYSGRGLEGGSGGVGELTQCLPAGPGGRRRGGGAGRSGRQPSFLRDLARGRARDPLPAPHSWRAAACPGVSVAASGSHGLTLRRRWGRGRLRLFCRLLRVLTRGCVCRTPGFPSLPVRSPAPALVRLVSLLQKSPSYSQRYCCW